MAGLIAISIFCADVHRAGPRSIVRQTIALRNAAVFIGFSARTDRRINFGALATRLAIWTATIIG